MRVFEIKLLFKILYEVTFFPKLLYIGLFSTIFLFHRKTSIDHISDQVSEEVLWAVIKINYFGLCVCPCEKHVWEPKDLCSVSVYVYIYDILYQEMNNLLNKWKIVHTELLIPETPCILNIFSYPSFNSSIPAMYSRTFISSKKITFTEQNIRAAAWKNKVGSIESFALRHYK